MKSASVDPRIGLGTAAVALAIAIGSPNVLAPLTVGAGAAAVLLGGSRWSVRCLLPLAPALALGLATGLLRAVLTPGQPALTVSIAGAMLHVSRPGLLAGGLILARVMAGATTALALAARLPFPHLLAALAWLRVPTPILEVLRIAERQRHSLSDAAAQVHAAATLRLGFDGTRRSLRSFGMVAGAIVCQAIDQASAVADAMELRGSSGLAGVELPPRCPRSDARFMLLALPVLACGLGLAVFGGSMVP